LAPQPQPQSMRGPGGRPPRLGFRGKFLIVPGTVGRRGQFVKWPRIWLVVSLAPQPHPHGIRGTGDRLMRLMALGSSRQIFTRTQLLHMLHVPDTQRLQNGSLRYLTWRSSPQHMQTRSGADSLSRSQLLHFGHVPDTHRLQYGRIWYSDWSAPQHIQARNVVGLLTPFILRGRPHRRVPRPADAALRA
jgi:hypothetical protein